MQRRIGAGRLSEVVGRSALRVDKFARTLGLYRRAKASDHTLTETEILECVEKAKA
jgi:penicillin amidase